MLKNDTQNLYNEEEIVLGNIDELLEETFNNNMNDKHKNAIFNENRRKDLEKDKK